MDQVEQGFTPQDEQNKVVAPERRNIPEEARAEIVRLFNDFKEQATKADIGRKAFTDFVNVVRKQLDIADNEFWNIDDEAMYFEKQIVPVRVPEPLEPSAADYAAAVSEGEDSSLEVPPANPQL